MRIALIYPPPWKIEKPGAPPLPAGEGPPKGADDKRLLDNDFLQAPYGMLSIAAQAIAAGHAVTTLNLSNACWEKVTRCVERLEADVFGLSCVTANRRGAAMTADWIRRVHPGVHITFGGAHATALPREILAYHPSVDTVVIGEGEATFMDLLGRLAAERPVAGIPGTAWRCNGKVVVEPRRPPIENLDALVPPQAYFSMHKVVTSRGCPGNCTFCASNLIWGRSVRSHSVAYVLNMVEAAVKRHSQRIITFRDDTFSADRERVLAICRGIRRRCLVFSWSCETRADCVDEEILFEMRRAGCRRISIGVESASAKILKTLRKRILPETVLRATQMAQKYGLQVRYYLMAGNRGESWETFQESLDFIRRARPNQFAFSQLHLYPGTTEFDIFRRHGVVSADTYFTGDFMHLTCFAGVPEDAERILEALRRYEGVQDYWEYSAGDYEEILNRFPDLPAAHLDLCGACLKEGDVARAERHLGRVRETGHPLPGLVYNAMACVAAERGNVPAAASCLDKALACYPHQVVVDNLKRLADWEERGGETRGRALPLMPFAGFETTFMRQYPESPDPDPLSDLEVDELPAW